MKLNKCAGAGCVRKLQCNRYDQSITNTLICQDEDYSQFQQLFKAKEGYHEGYTHFFSRPTKKISFGMQLKDISEKHVDNLVKTLCDYDTLGELILEVYNMDGIVLGYTVTAFKAEHKNEFQIFLSKDFE